MSKSVAANTATRKTPFSGFLEIMPASRCHFGRLKMRRF
jgi:hypothetical protein